MEVKKSLLLFLINLFIYFEPASHYVNQSGETHDPPASE